MDNSDFKLDDNIIAKLGLQEMSEEQRLALLDQMAELVQKRAILRVMDSLPEEAIEEANRLADQPEQLLEFLGTKVDIGQVILEETERLKGELVAEANEPTAEEVKTPPAEGYL